MIHDIKEYSLFHNKKISNSRKWHIIAVYKHVNYLMLLIHLVNCWPNKSKNLSSYGIFRLEIFIRGKQSHKFLEILHMISCTFLQELHWYESSVPVSNYISCYPSFMLCYSIELLYVKIFIASSCISKWLCSMIKMKENFNCCESNVTYNP